MRLTLLGLAAASIVLAVGAAAQPVPCLNGFAGEYECENVMLLSHVSLHDFASDAGSGHWGWTDEHGREYALIGLSDGTGFVDITDPVRPVYVGKLPTHTDPSTWRELKVYGPYALIVSEADGHGMQVFDLRRLREVAPADMPVIFDADAHYDMVGHSHNVATNEESRFAYIVGNREQYGCRGGLHMVDMRDPLRPTFAGCFAEDGYTHDVKCVNYRGPDERYHEREICFASNENTVTIVDVTDKRAPVMVSQAIYPFTAYTHQGWLTEDSRYFIVNDELDEMRYGFNTRTLVFDFDDLEQPEFVGDHFGPTRAVAHNLYVRGEAVYMANYRRGLEIARIDDVSEAALTNIAFFDTFPENTSTQFGGAWNTYAFYASGTVTIADSNRGLFMVRPFRKETIAVQRLHTVDMPEGVLIDWRVDDHDVERFVVEHLREDGHRDLATVRARPEQEVYRIRVELAAGEHALRLRAVDSSGMTSYSDVFTVVREQAPRATRPGQVGGVTIDD